MKFSEPVDFSPKSEHKAKNIEKNLISDKLLMQQLLEQQNINTEWQTNSKNKVLLSYSQILGFPKILLVRLDNLPDSLICLNTGN